ncbi:MAG TPA: hypothetical protein VL359_04100, partial [bacterium]|nr:hypothetical protein [bacterium]
MPSHAQPFPLPMSILREAVWSSLRATLGSQPPPQRLPQQEGGAWEPHQAKRVGRQILALHEAYTTGGGAFAHEENPIHSHLAGYQLYFMPRNLFRVYHTLLDLPWQPLPARQRLAPWLDEGPAGPTLRVADLGCGTGAFSLAVLSWLASLLPGTSHGSAAEELPALHLTLVDQGRTLLGLAQATLQACARQLLPGLRLSMEQHPDGVERHLAKSAPPHAIVGSALMLNELRLLGPGRAAERPLRL